MKKVKLGIIGCGIITSEAHLPAIKRLEHRVEVIAVCNRSEGKAINLAKELNLSTDAVWTDWQQMIKDVHELDAVLIALPILLSHSVSKACCEAGLSVICEKPAGKDDLEAADTISFSSKYNVRYLTAENFQYEPKFNKAAELLKKGIIGKLHSTNWNVLTFMDVNNKYNKTSWRAHNEYKGGYVLDGGVHVIHALEMIAGPIRSVFAHTASIEKNLGSMDSALSLLEHQNGVISSLNMGWRHANDDGFLKLYGETGSLIIKDDVIIHLNETNEVKEYSFEKEDSFYLQWGDFLQALETGKDFAMPVDTPAKDVKVIMAMIESGKMGTKIEV